VSACGKHENAGVLPAFFTFETSIASKMRNDRVQ